MKALLEVKAATLRGETKHIEYDNLNVATWIQRFHTVFKIAINAAVEEEILQRNRFTRITITNPNDTTEPAMDMC